MQKKFSTAWKSSRQRRKQRKYRENAPLHLKQKFIKVHLSKELIKKYGKRSIGLRKGDKVIIQRGQFKGKSGKVERVSVKLTRAYVAGIDVIKKEGSKALIPLQPSNLMITELNIDDKKRMKRLSEKK